MPRYGYGYAQSPDDMATGNPFYNPNRPGPDWAAGVAAFYQNLQQAKDRKRAQQQQDEELRWQNLQRELAMRKQEMDMAKAEREAQDYVPEKQKMAYDWWMKGLQDNLKRKRELEDAEAGRKHDIALAKVKASVSAAEDIEKEGVKDLRAAHKTDIATRRSYTKRMSEIKKQIDEADKYIVGLKYKLSVAVKNKNLGFADALSLEIDRKKNEMEILQSEFDTIAEKNKSSWGGGDEIPPPPAGFQIIK